MNFDFNFFFVLFVVLMIYLAVVVPVSGYIGHKKLKKPASVSTNNKIHEYQHIIIWSWLPVLLIVLLVPFSGVTLSNLGFRWITINITSLSSWIVIPFIILCGIYFLYNLYLIIILKTNKNARAEASKNFSENVKLILPVTKQEKKNWIYVALTAGITEEIVYRSYMFFAFATLFPSLSIYLILVISTVLFGVGHIYQGKDGIKPAILGLLFGFSYIIFDSIIPVIVLHCTQDLVVTNLIGDEQ